LNKKRRITSSFAQVRLTDIGSTSVILFNFSEKLNG